MKVQIDTMAVWVPTEGDSFLDALESAANAGKIQAAIVLVYRPGSKTPHFG